MKDGLIILMLLMPSAFAWAQDNSPQVDHTRPAWSPDGQVFAYLSNETGVNQVFLADLQTRTARRVTQAVAGVTQFKWSPEANKLAYLSGQALFILDLESLTTKRLVSGGPNPLFFAWAPDARGITYSCSGAGGSTDICLKTLADGKEVYLVAHEATERNFSWSPDGQRLAFGSDRDGAFNIYLLDVASGAITRLTDVSLNAIDPLFSADGQHLAFIADREGDNMHFDVYIVERGSRKKRQVTVLNGYNLPLWFPEGERFLVNSNGRGAWEIFKGEVGNRGIAKWADGLAFSISPDGSTVLVQSQIRGKQEIFLARVDGQQRQALTAWLAN